MTGHLVSEVDCANAPMRVLLLCTGLKMGGAEQQVVALARQFLSEGHAVAIVSLTAGQEVETPADAMVQNLEMRKGVASFVKALWRLRQLVRTWQPDVIHAHMVHANVVARTLAALSDIPPVISSAHSAKEGGSVRMLAYRLTDRWSALTTHVSDAGRDAMIAAGAVGASRIHVMPNGIDMLRFRSDPLVRDNVRRALGIGPDTRMIINVGRLVPEKAQNVLIDAFARTRELANQGDVRLVIVGEGIERARLETQIKQLDLAESVTLLGLRHDVPALLAAADLFVLSSNVEGLPLVIGEALATGCPVVATDAAGVEELLGPCGSPVKRDDVSALAAAMASASEAGRGSANDQQIRRQWVTTQFSLEAVAAQWLASYRRLASASRAGISLEAVR